MMREEPSKAENKNTKQKGYIYSIGFFGGLFASLTAYIAHIINFVPFGPGMIWQLWPTYEQTAWMRRYPGHLLSIVLISLLSVFIAWLYYALFRKKQNVWFGIWFGIALWVLLFIGLHSLIPGVKSVHELGWNTNIVFLSIFALYGLFVGYSIYYESELHEKGRG